jgi:uncharacterized Zn finger protein (UPF0148 family)
MSNIVRFIELLQRMSNDNVLNRSFNDQGDHSKPCSASFVNKLEKMVITNEDRDNELCCAICQEEFKLGDNVIKLPCKDPHYFHYESPEDECGGILPWLKNNNSCPVCREEFPEEKEEKEEKEEEDSDIPIPDENFDGSEPTVNDTDPNLESDDTDIDDSLNASDTDGHINEQIDDIIHRLFTIRRINTNRELLFNPRNSIYIPNQINSMNGSNSSGTSHLPTIINLPPLLNISPPMIIPMNNYSEDEDPALQEAIRQSLES